MELWQRIKQRIAYGILNLQRRSFRSLKQGLVGLQHPGVMPRIQFLNTLGRARALADRHGFRFSLAVFTIPAPHFTSTLRTLTHLTFKRKRTTDDIGWLEKDLLGLYLPYTSSADAWTLVGDILAHFPDKAPIPHCSMYDYPPTPSDDSGSDRDDSTQRDIPSQGSPARRGLFGSEAVARKGTRGQGSEHAKKVETTTTLDSFLWHSMPRWKRGLDILGATLALVLLGPLMLVIAAGIKLTSQGEVVFRQQRAGLGNKPFTLYKFRSMSTDAERVKSDLLSYNERKGPAFKMRHDPRVTGFGRIIRAWSLDELPQLFNVLRGDMSLVGPRPLPLEESECLSPWQTRRLHVTPGITCLWQVYARHDTCFDRWTRLDLEYIAKRSPWLDMRILVATLPAILLRRGAC